MSVLDDLEKNLATMQKLKSAPAGPIKLDWVVITTEGSQEIASPAFCRIFASVTEPVVGRWCASCGKAHGFNQCAALS